MAKQETSKHTVTKKHIARKQREEKQTRIILIATIVIGVIIVGLVGYGLIDQLVLRPATPVAKVGDQAITVKEFESRVQYSRVQMLIQAEQYYQYGVSFGEYGSSFLQTALNITTELNQPVAYGSNILDVMIDDILIQEEAAARGITVSDAEVDEAIQTAFGFFPDGTPTPTQTATVVATPTYSSTMLALVPPTATPEPTDAPTATPEVTATEAETATESTEDNSAVATDEAQAPEETPTITPTPTQYTTEVFGQNVKDYNDSYGVYDWDIDQLRDAYRTELLRQKLVEVVTADMEPVQEEVWARHILVETEEEAQEVLDKLAAGEDWVDLAAQYSTDDANKDQGGDLGWFAYGDMVSAFADVAFSLNEGEISEPVETDFGFHIIQLVGKRESQTPAADFANDKEVTFETWLSEKRNARGDIEIYDNWEEFVPTTPAVSTEFLNALYSAVSGN